MKTIRYMIAATIISASLFAACNKQNSLENGLTSATANETINNKIAAATIHYQLQTVLPPQGLIKWNNGYITVSELVFNGVHDNGEMLRQEQFMTTVGKTFPLFGTNALGLVSVPFSTYSNASFAMQLNPVNKTGSLYLSGIYNAVTTGEGAIPPPGGIAKPVQVIINDPVTLSSEWLTNNVAIARLSYNTMLSFNINSLINGITPKMLDAAETTEGVIVINNISNKNLYGIILGNIQTSLMKVQFSSTIDVPVKSTPVVSGESLPLIDVPVKATPISRK